MDTHSGITESVWIKSALIKNSVSLDSNDEADVCIIGAGIAGLTTAYLMAREGRKVIVVDDGPIESGMSSRTTAHLSNSLDNRYYKLEHIRGTDIARLAAESHTAAIAQIASIIESENIECDFERLDGYLFLGPGDASNMLDEELSCAHRIGLTDVVMLERSPIESFDSGPCLRFPGLAQFHPIKYMNGLVMAIERNGGHVYSQTHINRIQGGDSPSAETAGGLVVSARDIVVATNSPINNVIAIYTKQSSYMTYVIGARIPRGSVQKALYWDTQDPYHYIRLYSPSIDSGTGENHDILIVGGEDHKTGQADDGADRLARLEDWSKSHFPMICQIDYKWSGHCMETLDGLAFIGHDPGGLNHVYIATGDSGMGMTHGTIAGLLIRDLILGYKNSWEEAYDPARKDFKALGKFAEENINVAAELIKGHLSGSEIKAREELAIDQGAVISRGLKKIAVFRSENGHFMEHSAICRHLGCVVSWNSLEKTWDCPCHGSRYNSKGHVFNGPATFDLKKNEDQEIE